MSNDVRPEVQELIDNISMAGVRAGFSAVRRQLTGGFKAGAAGRRLRGANLTTKIGAATGKAVGAVKRGWGEAARAASLAKRKAGGAVGAVKKKTHSLIAEARGRSMTPRNAVEKSISRHGVKELNKIAPGFRKSVAKKLGPGPITAAGIGRTAMAHKGLTAGVGAGLAAAGTTAAVVPGAISRRRKQRI